MNFRTNNVRAQYRVVPHGTHIIFTSKIVFKKLASVFPLIPPHKFFLQYYNRLYPRLNKLDVLTDKHINITAVPTNHCCFYKLEDNIILNNTGSTLFFIDLDIPELNAYKSMFSSGPHFMKTLPPSSKQANEQNILQTGKKVTIEDLGYLDPDLYKVFDKTYLFNNLCMCKYKFFNILHNDTFLCKASIKRYNTRYKVFLVLEGEIDEINALTIGRLGEKPYPDLTIQPATPQSLSREITVSSTTISSSTTHVDTTDFLYHLKKVMSMKD
ncbi:hypothetical protein DVH24_025976 [Malus domestica]|uniref:Uncharacterized protein n=1 Tax=Malus domestica TaxID=3750 RepID=A0A498KER3_MALDO|nr:hypothetical protein DVH24_025976 [Malus domestica]